MVIVNCATAESSMHKPVALKAGEEGLVQAVISASTFSELSFGLENEYELDAPTAPVYVIVVLCPAPSVKVAVLTTFPLASLI